MDYLNSFFQNIKDKLSNPFFGTLTFILIIHHWQFWYTIFTFEDKVTRVEKIKVLAKLINREFTSNNILCDILFAIIITLVGYLIVVATRALSLWIEFRLMPWLTGKIINKNVVLKNTYDDVVAERDEYAEKYEEQRKNVRVLSRDFDAQTEENKRKDATIIENSAAINDLQDTISKRTDENRKLSAKISKLEIDAEANNKKIIEQEQLINSQAIEIASYSNILSDKDNSTWVSEDKFPLSVAAKVKELKENKLWDVFNEVGIFVKDGGSVASQYIDQMELHGIIIKAPNQGRTKFTPLGEIIWKFRGVFNK
jgi:hypothetical protein